MNHSNSTEAANDDRVSGAVNEMSEIFGLASEPVAVFLLSEPRPAPWEPKTETPRPPRRLFDRLAFITTVVYDKRASVGRASRDEWRSPWQRKVTQK